MSASFDYFQAVEDRRAYEGFLKQLLEAGELSEPASGITMLVIAQGRGCLTPKQAFVFRRDVEDAFPQPVCDGCGAVIPWSEAFEFMHFHGCCSCCRHTRGKLMRD